MRTTGSGKTITRMGIVQVQGGGTSDVARTKKQQKTNKQKPQDGKFFDIGTTQTRQQQQKKGQQLLTKQPDSLEVQHPIGITLCVKPFIIMFISALSL